MSFAHSGWLYFLWLIPILAVLVGWDSRVRRRQLRGLFGDQIALRVFTESQARRRAWKWMLWLLGVAALVFAAAQPRWGFTWKDLQGRGVEIVIAMDVSRSMDAQDVDPSRIERARREVSDLLDLSPGDRVGLVVFAGGAYPRVPLTRDRAALWKIVRDTDTQVISAQGSSIGSALQVALDLFGEETASHRAVVIVSDGEVFDEEVEAQVKALAEQGIRVYSVGIGTTDGAPIPEVGGGFKLDRSGEMVLTRLDTSSLERVAASTGGAYVQSVAGAEDMRQLVRAIQGDLEAVDTESQRERIWDERFQWPLAWALVLLFAAGVLGDGRRVMALGLLWVITAPSTAWAGTSEDLDSLWGEAASFYAEGQYEASHQVFGDLADRGTNPQLVEAARYNAGNASYRAGRLEDALSEWGRILEQNPDHLQASANAERVGQELQARRTPPQEEPESQDGSDQQDGEEGQDSEEQAESEGEDSSDSSNSEQAEGSQQESENEPDTGDLDLSQLQEDSTGGEEESQQSAPLPEGVAEMSAQDALRLLEAVEEGRPRVVVGGRSQERDW